MTRRNTKRWMVGALIGALALLLAGAGIAWRLGGSDSPDSEVGALHDVGPASVLTSGRLPPLPQSAKDVIAARWAGVFSGARYLRLRAEPEDVQTFIAAAGLRVGQCSSVSRDAGIPDWFVPDRLDDPQCFPIAPERDHNWGTVWVQGDTVFVEVVWS